MPVFEKTYDDSHEPEFRTVAEEAQARGLCNKTIYNHIESGKIKFNKIHCPNRSKNILCLIPVDQDAHIENVEYLSPGMVAKILKVNIRYIYKLIKKRSIPFKSYKNPGNLNRIIVIPMEEFKEWCLAKRGINLDEVYPLSTFFLNEH